MRRSAARSVPGREVAPRWAHPEQRSGRRERLLAQLLPARRQAHRRSAQGSPLEVCRPEQQPQAARPDGPSEWLAAWLVQSSSFPQQAGSSAVCRRAAAVPSSGFRRAVWLPAATRVDEFAEQAPWSRAGGCLARPLAGSAAGMLPARQVAPPSEPKAAGSA